MPIRIRSHGKRQKLCKSLKFQKLWRSDVLLEWRLIRTENGKSCSYADPAKYCLTALGRPPRYANADDL